MRKSLLVVLMLGALSTPQAVAKEWYVAARAGVTTGGQFSDFDLSSNTTYGVAAGWRFHPNFRAELSVTNTPSGGVDVGPENELQYWDAALTLYADLPVTERLSLFAGAGVDRLDGEFTISSFTPQWRFTGDGWHVAAGASYRVASKVDVEIQYRHLDASTERDGDPTPLFHRDLSADSVSLGVRVGF